MNGDPELDVAIIGDGPTALALADQLRRQHLDVLVVGPRHPWAGLLPAWVDDLEPATPGPVAAPGFVFAWKAERVTMWGTRRHPVARSFGVLDTMSLARRSGLRLARRTAEVVGISHFAWGSRATLADGDHVDAKLVVNVSGLGAMGHRPADEPTKGPFRSTWHAGDPSSAQREVVLFDFRPSAPWSDRHPLSFRTVGPEGSGRRLHLTTIGHDRADAGDMAEAVGLDAATGEHYVHPVGGVPPTQVATASFGTAAGYSHPMVGYSVATAYRRAPAVAAEVAAAIGHGVRGPRLVDAAWAAVWPPDLRRTRHLQLISLEALMSLGAGDVARFFDIVFEQPAAMWAPYLRIDTPPRELATSMTTLSRRSPWSIRRHLGRRRTFGWRRAGR